MLRLEIHPTHPQQRKIQQAVDILEAGGVIAYPTDSVYGLGCDIHNKKAVERIYQMKRMDSDHLVGFVCPDLGDIARYAFVDDAAYRVMRRLLPGPYTFILRARKEVPKILMMKRKTVGIRVPDHPVALALVKTFGRPIVSSSATIDGEVLNDPDDIVARFKQLDAIIDSGWGGVQPSTVIDLSGDTPAVVREGAGPVDFL